MPEGTPECGELRARRCIAGHEAREQVDGKIVTRLVVAPLPDTDDGDQRRECAQLRARTVPRAREERAIQRQHRGALEIERVRNGERGNRSHFHVVAAATKRRVRERAPERDEEKGFHRGRRTTRRETTNPPTLE